MALSNDKPEGQFVSFVDNDKWHPLVKEAVKTGKLSPALNGHRVRKIALDMGRVLVKRGKYQGTDYRWAPRSKYHLCPPMPGVYESVKRLVDKYGTKNVFIIKHVPSQFAERQAIRWLHYNDFFRRTGVRRENLLCSPTRLGKIEFYIRYGITDVVEDRYEVLAACPLWIRLYAFQPRKEERREFEDYLPGKSIVWNVRTWRELRRILLRDPDPVDELRRTSHLREFLFSLEMAKNPSGEMLGNGGEGEIHLPSEEEITEVLEGRGHAFTEVAQKHPEHRSEFEKLKRHELLMNWVLSKSKRR